MLAPLNKIQAYSKMARISRPRMKKKRTTYTVAKKINGLFKYKESIMIIPLLIKVHSVHIQA